MPWISKRRIEEIESRLSRLESATGVFGYHETWREMNITFKDSALPVNEVVARVAQEIGLVVVPASMKRIERKS